MNTAVVNVRGWLRSWLDGWNRFWFTPTDPATLGLIRILAGALLLYTHLVWTLGLEDFFGPNGWIPLSSVAELPGRDYTWSFFYLIESPTLLWTVHIAALVVFAMLTLGIFSRATSILAFLMTVSYANRVPGALFGLDDINAMLAMYLMVGPCGARYSFDHWWASRHLGSSAPAAPSVSANIAIRLIQLHMCIIYLFSGMGKLLGAAWWDGTALWGAFANLEYQSLDMTWLAWWPSLIAVMTHLTVWWELFYCALIWPRLTRPIMLFLAIVVHLGIGFCLGMMTFGLAMVIGNLAFVPPNVTQAVIDRLVFWRGNALSGAGQGGIPKSLPNSIAAPRSGSKARSH